MTSLSLPWWIWTAGMSDTQLMKYRKDDFQSISAFRGKSREKWILEEWKSYFSIARVLQYIPQ